ncbi:MAG: dihydropteroate synthase [Bacillota bacterium]
MAVSHILASGADPGGRLRTLALRTRTLAIGERTYLMGVLNVTPDSFSDGDAYPDAAAAVSRALEMVGEGADLIDVGGESTRPGAADVPEDEELRRVVPVIRALASQTDVPISVDTRKARVAQAAVEAGAQLVNDVSGLAHDPEMARTVARLGVPVVVMHMRGTPATMQNLTAYEDVVADSARELRARVRLALDTGISPDRIVVDPGFGFAKTAEQNFELLARLPEWAQQARLPGFEPFALLVGTSRKSFIGKVLGGLPPLERVEGTAATVALAIAGGADIVRVHDVKVMRRVAAVADAVVRRRQRPASATDEVTVEVGGMTFSACHGVHDKEKVNRQPFEVDVKLWLRSVPSGDRLEATVDYGEVYRVVQGILEGPSVSLIETLAGAVADAIEARYTGRLRRLQVRVRKPDAPLPGPTRDVAATVDRILLP